MATEVHHICDWERGETDNPKTVINSSTSTPSGWFMLNVRGLGEELVCDDCFALWQPRAQTNRENIIAQVITERVAARGQGRP